LTACLVTGAGLVGAAADEDRHLVMLGNSMQGCGIDFPALSQAVGRRVDSKARGGVMSAHKFAMLWHAAHAAKKPEAAVIVFRRDNITRPTVRVTEKYGEKLRGALTDPELKRIVEEVAYPSAKPAPDKNFEALVSRSFVPHMIRVAKEAGVTLVLARCKSRKYAEDPDHETPAMRKYDQELTDYLQERGAHFLDYVHEPGIKPEHYANGDHLNEAGRQAWTPLMAEDLSAILAGKRAPRERTDLAGRE